MGGPVTVGVAVGVGVGNGVGVGVDVGVKVGEEVGTGVNVATGGVGDGAAATARSAAGLRDPRAAHPARHRHGSRTASSSQPRRGWEAWIRMGQVPECRFKVGVAWWRPPVPPLSVGEPRAQPASRKRPFAG